MKERTYQGEIFIANSVKKVFYKPIVRSFSSVLIRYVKGGLNISGVNVCFKKDNIVWGAMVCKGKVIYFENDTDKKWMMKPILDFLGWSSVSCIIKENEDYLIKKNKVIQKMFDTIASEINSRLNRKNES